MHVGAKGKMPRNFLTLARQEGRNPTATSRASERIQTGSGSGSRRHRRNKSFERKSPLPEVKEGEQSRANPTLRSGKSRIMKKKEAREVNSYVGGRAPTYEATLAY